MLKKSFGVLAAIAAIVAVIYLIRPAPKSTLIYEFQAGPADIAEDLFDNLSDLKIATTPCLHPLVCEMLKKVQSEIPRYHSYLREGLKLAAGKKIDFVLFYHLTMVQYRLGGSQVDGEDPVKTATESVKMVERVLFYMKPDVIGTEGCYAESHGCTRQQEVEDARRMAREFDIPLSEADLAKGMKSIDDRLWYVRFGEKNPDLNIVGIDEIYLQTLDQMLVNTAINNNTNYDESLVELLYILRSVWAVARMGHLLKDRQSGVIVMGYAHGSDFKVLAQRLGLQSRIISAIPENVKMPGF